MTVVAAFRTLLFSLDEYIRRWPSRLDAHQLRSLPVGSMLTVMVNLVESETGTAVWQRP